MDSSDAGSEAAPASCDAQIGDHWLARDPAM